MGDQLVKAELHVDAAIGRTEGLLVEVNGEFAAQAFAVPGCAQFVRCDCHRRKRCRALAVDKTKTFAQFRRDEIAQRHVVEDHQQADVIRGLVRWRTHRHIVKHYGDLGFEIDAPFLGQGLDRVARPDEIIRIALVHQRVLLEFGRHRRATRLPDKLNMREVGAGIEPLIGARQRRGKQSKVGFEHAPICRGITVNLFVKRTEL